MPLYLVIYIAGLVGATIGPLPMTLPECLKFAAYEAAQMDTKITTPQGYSSKDIRFSCEMVAVPPDVDPQAGAPRGP